MKFVYKENFLPSGAKITTGGSKHIREITL